MQRRCRLARYWIIFCARPSTRRDRGVSARYPRADFTGSLPAATPSASCAAVSQPHAERAVRVVLVGLRRAEQRHAAVTEDLAGVQALRYRCEAET